MNKTYLYLNLYCNTESIANIDELVSKIQYLIETFHTGIKLEIESSTSYDILHINEDFTSENIKEMLMHSLNNS
uniref:Uncharacterized protein n=1 Tax=viral metagenome TaxID=1070528 RepID=A0A6C0JYJ7_9ZZZZ